MSPASVLEEAEHELWKARGRWVQNNDFTTNLDSVLKNRDYHFVNKGPYSQSYGLSDRHVQM